MPKTIYVLNGPNMNLLGSRQPEIYGRATIKDVEKLCRDTGKRHGFAIEFHCSNHEGKLVDLIQEAGAKRAAGIIINGAGFTTTSIAIHDALKAVSVPAIEVHVTNIFARETWRHASVIAPVAKATMAGFGIHGYALAIEAMAQIAKAKLAETKLTTTKSKR
jgi:3-dehydroquinate dehydratase-2